MTEAIGRQKNGIIVTIIETPCPTAAMIERRPSQVLTRSAGKTSGLYKNQDFRA